MQVAVTRAIMDEPGAQYFTVNGREMREAFYDSAGSASGANSSWRGLNEKNPPTYSDTRRGKLLSSIERIDT